MRFSISRFAFALVLVLGLSIPAWAQVTLVGQDFQDCGTTAATCTSDTGISAASGDFVVVLASNRDAAHATSVSDGVNGSYTCPDTVRQTVAGSAAMSACYLIGSGSGTVTAVVTWSASSRGYINVQVWRPTGTAALDATVETENATPTTTHTTGTLSTGATAALVVCGYGSSANSTGATAGTGYTKLTDADGRAWWEYDITSVASGSFTCDMTTTASVVSAGVGLSFSDSGAAASSPKRLTLLGVGQ